MSNGNARSAMIGVVLLTIVGVIASVIVFATTSSADTQRAAIFTGTLFGFLAPTIGVLLLNIQNKDVADKASIIAGKAKIVQDQVNTVAQFVGSQHTQLVESLTEAQANAATPQEIKARADAPVIGTVLVQPSQAPVEPAKAAAAAPVAAAPLAGGPGVAP